MNDQRVKTDNDAAIAEFMDFRLDDHLSRVHGDAVYSHPTKGWWPVDEPFIKDWNNRMEVIEKIEMVLSEYPNKDNSWLYWKNVFDGYVSTKIQVTNASIIGFIHWYQKQKSS